MSMNFERARFNMVEQQVRPWEVIDERILSQMESIHREDFVPVRYRQTGLRGSEYSASP